MHFAKGRSSPFGDVGYAAPFDGKLTKSLELKLLLKFALVGINTTIRFRYTLLHT